jgi:hypothetical protein
MHTAPRSKDKNNPQQRFIRIAQSLGKLMQMAWTQFDSRQGGYFKYLPSHPDQICTPHYRLSFFLWDSAEGT